MTTESTVPTHHQTQSSNSARDDGSGQEDTRADETFVSPPVDIYEDDQGLVILADLPGVDPSSLDVRLDRGLLTMQGRAHHMVSGQPIYREFELSGFYRQFRLPEDIDSERVEADLKEWGPHFAPETR